MKKKPNNLKKLNIIEEEIKKLLKENKRLKKGKKQLKK